MNEIKECATSEVDSMTPEEYADVLIGLLKLQKSNDELQNELFEIIGFDRFELIQKLLDHRDEIIKQVARPYVISTGMLYFK